MHQFPESRETNAPVRVVLADDHARHRRLMAMALELGGRIAVVGEASDGAEAASLVRDLDPDIVLLDARMPGVGGVEACALISKLAPRTQSIMLTMSDDPDEIDAAFDAGAKGYLFKSVESGDIVDTVVRVAGLATNLEPGVPAAS